MRRSAARTLILFVIAFSVAPVLAAPAIGGLLGSHPLAQLATVVVNGIQDSSKPADITVDVKTKDEGGTRWVVSPVWMAIGALALIVIILLIVTAFRGQGGGTTVVHE